MTEEQREANRARLREWHRRNPHKKAEYKARYLAKIGMTEAEYAKWYYAENREARRANARGWYQKNRERACRREQARRVDATPDDLQAMSIAQGDRCAICARAETKRHKDGALCRLSVDHDHETGRVRGLLCDRCNRGIGLLRDDPRVLENAVAYLRRIT